MYKRVSPVQAARQVLKAFPYVHAGAEVSSNHVAHYFQRQGYPMSDMVAGVHYAASSGWIARADVHSLKLTQPGVEALADEKVSPVPISTWHAWAHP